MVYTASECRVYNAADELVLSTPRDRWPYFHRDAITGERYIYVYSDPGGYDVYSTEGEFILHTESWADPTDGLFLCSDNLTTGYRDLAGDWVFRIRVDQGD